MKNSALKQTIGRSFYMKSRYTIINKDSETNKVIRLSMVLSVAFTLPILFINGYENIMFVLTQFIQAFILFLITTKFGITISKHLYNGDKGKAIVYITIMYIASATLITISDKTKGFGNAPDIIKAERYMMSSFFDNIPLYRKLLLLFIRPFFLCCLLIYITWNEISKDMHIKKQQEMDELKAKNADIHLKLLKQQMSPHFLFNSLSTLKSIANDERTKRYITKLSDVYRYFLTKKEEENKDLVRLEDELEFIRAYLYILYERFEDGLKVDIDITDEAKMAYIPPLAIQILIENATKHNIIAAEEPLHIRIYNEDNTDNLIVSNNIQPRISHSESFGIGLSNLRARYKILNNSAIEINENGKTFVVKIPLINKS